MKCTGKEDWISTRDQIPALGELVWVKNCELKHQAKLVRHLGFMFKKWKYSTCTWEIMDIYDRWCPINTYMDTQYGI